MVYLLRRSLLHRPVAPSDGATALSVAQANNATHFWQAADYDVAGWDDAIASVTLSNSGTSNALASTVSEVDVVAIDESVGAYLQATFSYADPYEMLFLAQPNNISNNASVLTTSDGIVGLFFSGGFAWRFRGGSSPQTAPIQPVADWQVFYINPAADGTTRIKVGGSTIETLSAGATSPSGLILGARSGGSFPSDLDVAYFAMNTNGDWSDANINAIAQQMLIDAAALSPLWSDIT